MSVAERELPRHADHALDRAGLHAAQLLEQALDQLVDAAQRARFAPYRALAADLRDARGEALRRSAVAIRAALGPGDGLADVVDAAAVTELREALDLVLRILNRRSALRGRVSVADEH